MGSIDYKAEAELFPSGRRHSAKGPVGHDIRQLYGSDAFPLKRRG